MNEDDAKLIAECQRYSTEALSPTNRDFYARITQRLRELLTPDDNKGSIPAVINAPPCDAATALAMRVYQEATGRTCAQTAALDAISHLITSALTAHGEAVRERIAEWIRTQRNDVPMTGEEAANAIRALNLTEAG